MTEATRSPAAPGLRAVDRYIMFWNAATSDEQQLIASETFVDDVSYHVPLGVMRGPEQLIGFRNEFAQNAPAFTFRARAEPDTHHDRARLQWELVTADGESFAAGTDVLELDERGSIVAVTGFVDQAPAGFDPHARH